MPFGIDHASIDGNSKPDYAAAKAAGCRFVIIRASYSTWQDPTINRDREAIRAAGMRLGAYLFPLMNKTSATPEDQVKAFLENAKLRPGQDFAPILDLEWPGGIAKTGRSVAEIVEWIRRAISAIVAGCGVRPIIYSSARVLDGRDTDSLDNAADSLVAGSAAWLARYPYKTRIKAVIDGSIISQLDPPPVPTALGDSDNWWIHQYQGDAIGCPGFNSTVDLNRFNLLSHGARGERVRWVQQRLGMAEGSPAVWDAAMEQAVYEFQQGRGLFPDRIIGPATFAALSWELPGSTMI